jgi:transposase
MSDSSPPRSGSDAVATSRWVERLKRFASANQTVAAFCAVEGVSPANFYLWRRRLAESAPSPAVRVPTVVPIQVAPPHRSTTPIELTLPSGATLQFPADVSPEMLVAVLRGLEKRSC